MNLTEIRKRYLGELREAGENTSMNSTNCSPHLIPSRSSAQNDALNMCSLHELPMPKLDLSKDIQTRRLSHVFERSPLKVSRGVKQYLYDDDNVEYLDCVNGTAHVGHCHPQVVSAGHSQMSKLSTAQGFVSDILNKYVKELVQTLPEPLSVCYLTNSGSEANDLALRLAFQYTGRKDIVSVEDGYHGNLGVLVDISHKMHERVPNFKKPDWVHHVPLPDTFRNSGPDFWSKYIHDFEKRLEALEAEGRSIAAFIFEPFFVIAGLHIPPASFIKSIFRIVRAHGGIVISDEVQTGLGRSGEYLWGFMNYEVVPDIVTVGKPLGNGHPMGGVICSSDVSSKLGSYFSTFGGNPVSCAIGLSVLEIVRNEKLLSSARMVGKYMKTEFELLKERYEILGDYRGLGLVLSLEIVHSKTKQTPAPELSTEVMYGLKNKNILVAITGKHRNIILISPPMCFNMENGRRLCKSLSEVLSMVEKNLSSHSVIVYRDSLEPIPRERLKRPIIGGEVEAKRRHLESESSGSGYEDMD